MGCSALSGRKARQRAAATRFISLFRQMPRAYRSSGTGIRLGCGASHADREQVIEVLKDAFVPNEEMLMPHGIYFQAATRWPHMFLTLSPTYMGLAQAAYDFTVSYLRGEMPGTPPVKRRMYPTKQIAVAEMHIQLEQTKALWFQAISEACPDPSKEQVLRAYAAQHTVMENANAIAAKALRTCGGQAMLKSLALERIYRDSRCGSLMLPWTAEICVDRIGREALYEPGEKDD